MRDTYYDVVTTSGLKKKLMNSISQVIPSHQDYLFTSHDNDQNPVHILTGVSKQRHPTWTSGY